MGITIVDTLGTKEAVKTAAFTADSRVGMYLCDTTAGAFAATLPSVARSFSQSGKGGGIFVFKKTDTSANAITITAAGSDTIEGRTTFKLGHRNEFVALQADGVAGIWRVVARQVATNRLETIQHTAAAAVGPINGWNWFHKDFHEEAPAFYKSTSFTYSGGFTNTGDCTAADEAGGAVNFTSGATASSQAEAFGQNAVGGAVNAKAFYFQARFAVTTAVNNTATALVGVHDGTNSVAFGVVGSLSTTNLVMQHSGAYAGTKIDLAAVDTSYHVYEMWGDGSGVITYRIDGGATATVTPTNLTKLRYAIAVLNGATAAARTLKIDHYTLGCQP